MKNEISAAFASQMKRRRRELGLTQKTLAEKLNYSEKAISKWESAAALPPSSILPALSRELRCGIDDLFSPALGDSYYLGIDGGGTKTDLALIDSSGRLVNRVKLGASNPVDIGIEASLGCLSVGIGRVCAGVPYKRISVFAGIAGGSAPEYRSAILRHLSSFGFSRYECGSDADSIVEAGLYINGLPSDGVVVIMGTGSCTFARKNGKRSRLGGYGYLLGDSGCGFSIGRDAISAALRYEEGSGEPTLLRELICRQAGCEKVIDAIASFYQNAKQRIASYAPLVFEAYTAKDPVAREVLEENMRYVAEMITNAGKRLEADGQIRVVLAGGITKQADLLLPLIVKELDCPEKYSITVYRSAPVAGALILAGAESIERIK